MGVGVGVGDGVGMGVGDGEGDGVASCNWSISTARSRSVMFSNESKRRIDKFICDSSILSIYLSGISSYTYFSESRMFIFLFT